MTLRAWVLGTNRLWGFPERKPRGSLFSGSFQFSLPAENQQENAPSNSGVVQNLSNEGPLGSKSLSNPNMQPSSQRDAGRFPVPNAVHFHTQNLPGQRSARQGANRRGEKCSPTAKAATRRTDIEMDIRQFQLAGQPVSGFSGGERMVAWGIWMVWLEPHTVVSLPVGGPCKAPCNSCRKIQTAIARISCEEAPSWYPK